jgi:hypothetical protein
MRFNNQIQNMTAIQIKPLQSFGAIGDPGAFFIQAPDNANIHKMK